MKKKSKPQTQQQTRVEKFISFNTMDLISYATKIQSDNFICWIKTHLHRWKEHYST